MGKTNDTAPAKAERKAKRYTVIQRGPRVFEVMFVVSATHKTARLARAVARELNGEE